MSTACYLVNRSPATAIACKTPEEMWSGNPPDYSDLKIFGCPAYVHVNDGKLDPRAKKCIFLGYALGVKGYRFWCPDPKSPKFLIERNVTFDEFAMLSPVKEKDIPSDAGSQGSGMEKVEFENPGSTILKQSSQQQEHVPDTVQVEETPQQQ